MKTTPEKNQKKSAGRPTVMTSDTVKKLEEAFAIGCSDEEACFYADISKQTLYDYQKLKPEFIDRKEALKEKPILKARQTVIKGLDDPKIARWYLERKKKLEFAYRSELTGEDGRSLLVQPITGMVFIDENKYPDKNPNQ